MATQIDHAINFDKLCLTRVLGGVFFDKIFSFKQKMNQWADKLRKVLNKEYDDDDYTLEVDDFDEIIEIRLNDNKYELKVREDRCLYTAKGCKIGQIEETLSPVIQLYGWIVEIIETEKVFVSSIGVKYYLEVPLQEKGADEILYESYINESTFPMKYLSNRKESLFTIRTGFMDNEDMGYIFEIESKGDDTITLATDIRQFFPDKKTYDRRMFVDHLSMSTKYFKENALNKVLTNKAVKNAIDKEAFFVSVEERE